MNSAARRLHRRRMALVWVTEAVGALCVFALPVLVIFIAYAFGFGT